MRTMTEVRKSTRKFKTADAPPEIWKFTKEEKVLEGYFEGFVDSEVSADKTIRNAIVATEDGKRWQIALNNTLSYYFQLPKEGDYIRLTFLGKNDFNHPKLGLTKKNSYKFEWDPAVA